MQIESLHLHDKSLVKTQSIEICGQRLNLNMTDQIAVPAELLAFSSSFENPDLNIDWYDAKSLGLDEQIGNSVDADCHYQLDGQTKTVWQRDFYSINKHPNYQLVTKTDISDGIFNFLRWLMPPLLVDSNKVVMHSSCILTADNQAILCLGPSGAGKTTISSFAKPDRVLGDDLNIIHIDEEGIWVTPCPLGQRIQNSKLFNQWFRVSAIYWLHQHTHVERSPISAATQFVHLLESAANMDWPKLQPNRVSKIQENMLRAIQKCPMQKLSFPKDPTIWKTIEEFT